MGWFFLICILVVIGFGAYAIKTTVNKDKKDMITQAKQSDQKEYRKQCRVCGAVFCFTDTDLKISRANQNIAAINSMRAIKNSISGSAYHMYEQKKIANSALSRVVNYDKCPKCNSTDLIDITDERTSSFTNDVEQLKKFKNLLDEGIISQEEYEDKRKQILGL